SSGIVCATLILAPVAILSLNWLSTLSGNFHRVGNSTSLTFILVAIAAFFVFHLTQTLTVFRSAQEVLQFTYFRTALEVLGSYAFFSMAAFGAFYFLLPRVSGKGWLFPNMIKLHFWCALSGLVLLIGGLAMAGWVQGAAM